MPPAPPLWPALVVVASPSPCAPPPAPLATPNPRRHTQTPPAQPTASASPSGDQAMQLRDQPRCRESGECGVTRHASRERDETGIARDNTHTWTAYRTSRWSTCHRRTPPPLPLMPSPRLLPPLLHDDAIHEASTPAAAAPPPKWSPSLPTRNMARENIIEKAKRSEQIPCGDIAVRAPPTTTRPTTTGRNRRAVSNEAAMLHAKLGWARVTHHEFSERDRLPVRQHHRENLLPWPTQQRVQDV